MLPTTERGADLPPLCSPPQVETRRGLRTLAFAGGNVQSAMRVARPDQLVLAYARAMMCFALFVPKPLHILMVGLGGGSLAKFCYRHFPAARITVIELRADVIALREQFHIPADDARFQVVHADAAGFLAAAADNVDVLLVDGFDETGLPPALGSAAFYADCRRALRRDGVLAANIFSYDPRYAQMLGALRGVFGDRVCWFDGIAGNNCILFAVNVPLDGDPAAAPSRPLRVQQAVARRRGLGMPLLNRLLARATVLWLRTR